MQQEKAWLPTTGMVGDIGESSFLLLRLGADGWDIYGFGFTPMLELLEMLGEVGGTLWPPFASAKGAWQAGSCRVNVPGPPGRARSVCLVTHSQRCSFPVVWFSF